MPEDHCAEAYEIEEGDTVTIETSEGLEVRVDCESKDIQHSDDRSPAIFEQRTWSLFDRDGVEFVFGYVDGLSPHPDGGDAYPTIFEVHEPDLAEPMETPPNAKHGYITDVEVHE